MRMDRRRHRARNVPEDLRRRVEDTQAAATAARQAEESGAEETAAARVEAERAAIRAHVPWTRRVHEGKTTRDGETIDLPAFILRERETLVMKPNDEYGGKGVFIGWETSGTEWARALQEALRSPYVVQQRVELRRQSFPELGPELRFRDFVVDLDPYVFDGEVEGFLTRLSGTSLANVTSGGGQVPAFVVEPRS